MNEQNSTTSKHTQSDRISIKTKSKKMSKINSDKLTKRDLIPFHFISFQFKTNNKNQRRLCFAFRGDLFAQRL